MDSDGKEHSIARGAVASDGGGETRAYGHHITGSQHCLILFSLVTNKPTYVQNDQISCKQCSLAFTRSIKSKESHFENTPLDFFQWNMRENAIGTRNTTQRRQKNGPVSRRQISYCVVKRVKVENVARLARCLSSNCCENYLSCLVKYSHGKRLNYGQTDTWAVIQLFVVGLKSKPDYTTEMLLSLGGLDSEVRQKSLQRLRKHKAQQLASKMTIEYAIRRRMNHKLKTMWTEKEEDKKSRHKSNERAPTDACKSNISTKRKRGACSNCGDAGHYVNDCPEPRYGKNIKRQTGIMYQKELLDMFTSK